MTLYCTVMTQASYANGPRSKKISYTFEISKLVMKERRRHRATNHAQSRPRKSSSHLMNASIAACFCSCPLTADAEADGATEPVAAVPTIAGTTAVTTADGTPLDVKAATTEEDNADGPSRLGVGGGDVEASTSDFDLKTEETSSVDSNAEILDVSAGELAREGVKLGVDLDAAAV